LFKKKFTHILAQLNCWKKLLLPVFFLLVLITNNTIKLLIPKHIFAASLGLKPAHTKQINLEESLKPGEEKEFDFILVNLTDEKITVNLKVKNLKKTLDSGDYIYESPENASSKENDAMKKV
jgi:hypothetical protein